MGLSLNLHGCVAVDNETLEDIGKYCAQLEELDIGGCPAVGTPGLLNVVRQCKHMTIGGLIHVERDLITDEIVLAMMTNNPLLQVMDLNYCTQVTDETLLIAAQTCVRLRTLSLHCTPLVTAVGLEAVTEGCKSLIFTGIRGVSPADLYTNGVVCNLVRNEGAQMKRCDLSHCILVKDAVFYALAEHCPKLMQLCLQECRGLTAHGLEKLLQNCPLMQLDGIEECPREIVTNEVVIASITNNPRIHHLDLHDCSNVHSPSLYHVGDKCRDLRSLNLTDCFEIQEEALVWLLKNNESLLYIDIEGCPRVGDGALKQMGESCPKLQRLNIARCPKLTPKGIVSAITGCTLLNLEGLEGIEHTQFNVEVVDALVANHPGYGAVLDVSNCTWFTGESLKVLSKCKKLTMMRHLRLEGCVQIDDEGIAAIAKTFRRLTELDITRCFKVSDKGICAISKYCQDLDTLLISFCHRVSTKTMQYLGDNSKSLKLVDASYCGKVTAADVDRTQARLPKCKIVVGHIDAAHLQNKRAK